MESEQNEEITNTNLTLLQVPDNQNDTNTSLPSLALSDVSSDVIIQTNLIYGKKTSAYKAVVREYSKKTSVHGLNYIFEIHRPLYEKFYWIIFTLISLYLGIFFMWKTYVKWLDTPTVLGFDETLVQIHKIPFPTVTICPENKRDVTKFDFADVLEYIRSNIQENKQFDDGLPKYYVDLFLTTLQTCDQEVINRFAPFIPTNIGNIDVAQNLVDMSSDKDIIMQICKWNGHFDLYCRGVRKVLTDDGVCYQFNGLSHQDFYRNPDYISYRDKSPRYLNDTTKWSLDVGYQDQGFNTYPYRSIQSSARKGFTALLDSFQDDNDYVCNRFKQGFKVFLNSPDSVPVTTGNYILVPNSHEVMVTVLPQYITTLDNLQQFGPDKRQCYFNSERHLYFFKFYTQNNCQTECLTNYTIAKCGCAKFWMPKPINVPVCDLSKVSCYTNAAIELKLIIANQTAEKTKNANVEIICDCLPACNSLEYDFEITRAYLDAKATAKALRKGLSDDNVSRLVVYYRESLFTAIKRTVLYDLAQLIANCGGIFGLFMGISLLSVIEFIYFFSLRLFNNFRKRNGIQKKLELQKIEISDCS